VSELEARMARPGFWDRPDEARHVVAALKRSKRILEDWRGPAEQSAHLAEVLELGMAESDAALIGEVEKELEPLEKQVADLELKSLLSAEEDRLGALVTIHPGAGGTESQDWAAMLLRMYLRWAERHGYTANVLDLQPGEEAGIKDATVEVPDPFAYGYLKAESGVHRLVRISPFDAAHRRHTSFVSVFVFPLADEEIEVDVNETDLRVDTFRSSGAGGQHVNKTESAVRITHLPTGIVVQSQAERSQHRNRDNAMKILRSRLFVYLKEKEREKAEALTSTKKDIDFGSQIRSYVLHPYTMVNDHRTELKRGDVQAVLDGDLDDFINAYLRQRKSAPGASPR
jgi:peptide chain release factor 2